MIVDREWKKVEPVADDLIMMGFGFSCFDIHQAEIEGFQEVLVDWGKTAP